MAPAMFIALIGLVLSFVFFVVERLNRRDITLMTTKPAKKNRMSFSRGDAVVRVLRAL